MKKFNTEYNINNVGESVTLYGWASKVRNLGGIIFIDLRDRSGIMQLVINPESKCYEVANTIKSEYVISVSGVINKRSSVNNHIATGEIEVVVDSIEITDTMLAEINATIDQAKKDGYSNQAEFSEKKLNHVEKLLDVVKKHNIKPSIALLSKSFFKSNFSKETMRKLPMLFPGNEKTSLLGEVSSTLSSEQVGEGKLVYLFYYPGERREKIDVHGFSRDLLDAFKSIP